jgi:hypothetical protein
MSKEAIRADSRGDRHTDKMFGVKSVKCVFNDRICFPHVQTIRLTPKKQHFNFCRSRCEEAPKGAHMGKITYFDF